MSETTMYAEVTDNYRLPFDLYPFQQTAVNNLACLGRTGLYFEPGLGKTATATVCALFHRMRGTEVILILMPPIIIPTWKRWLARVTHKDGTPLKVLAYQGSPTQRKKMSFDADVILMSMQIFKKDFDRISVQLENKKVHTILDEAQCIKDVSTHNYKQYRNFVSTGSHQLLTGTPLNQPLDGYAYVKLVAPEVYANLAMFERIHVHDRDFFGNALSYRNLDLLASNLLVNADRKTKEEVLLDLPECIIQPVEYELDPAHLKLYRKLASEQLLKLPNGDKLDATQATALYHALGQIVLQWHYFGQDDALKSAGYDLLDQVLDELGDKKLIVFANYRRTNAEVVRRYGCPGVWGEVTAKAKQAALDRFMDDPKCRLITMMPSSGGVGVDGLQHVCADVLYLEPPIAVTHLTQSLSRVHRDGQRQVVTVRLARAIGTIQNHLVKRLSEKEALVNPLQGSRVMLQAAIFGE